MTTMAATARFLTKSGSTFPPRPFGYPTILLEPEFRIKGRTHSSGPSVWKLLVCVWGRRAVIRS